ncbi:alanine--tRNA ligase, mitochondrial isoform X1 [Dendroctonus ponderosae]|uniref:Alanine--tRNA ligase n=1 Tax=Dendroctonus ponderosae TaxID=77166 RepID=U4TYE1_DENPD|nr:alanine--tRNA ligase, mitochondrial isoform X1 [Dendroctonus ponderosae]ERL85827.1 hypothetical protein D910_03242 [Dendroctonus ponderosae]KAH1015189.1 hypothetical protein HUJ05_012957 [Dendroctonus ponderosae]
MTPYACPRLLCSHVGFKCLIIARGISKYIHRDISAKSIRQNFLNYFIEKNEHNFVRSSPVVPFCDPTVPFVNAGMNQFKGIFLGTQTPHFTKVTNSQKCVRVGGKHNDINIVGKDGYHHTFFEMLGNWSFGEYFKEEACKMAWELLTQVYKIHPSRLYVTYFAGDESLGLSKDAETYNIWKSLGIKNDRILPFGAKDNFWEMGVTGPCGPCTEIHFDHTGSANRAEFVNKDLHDLTEIWNLVFIQYNRQSDGSLLSLPKKHVDTGMGLERLCCALQGKSSTYDTDLFEYLINAIQKNCSNVQKYSRKFGEQDWNHIDTSYRILSDHLRMLTVCLADGVIPEQNQKLRRVIRKCFVLSETVFGKDKGLVRELSNYVVENLGDVYTELEKNVKLIHQILDYEEEIYKSIRTAARKEWDKLDIDKNLANLDKVDITPSFIKAYKELYVQKPTEIDGVLAHRLYDTHGFDVEAIQQLAEVLSIKFLPISFEKKMEEIKQKSKSNRQLSIDKLLSALTATDLKKTDDSGKYIYNKKGTQYDFPEIQSTILQIVDHNSFISQVKDGQSCGLILDKTNFYCEAGGQECDKGQIHFHGAKFQVETVSKLNDVIVHRGYLKGDAIKVGAQGRISVDREYRLRTMQNHTCAHLLNAAIKQIKSATCQKSSKVTNQYVNLDVSVFGPKFNIKDVIRAEEIISKVIQDQLNVRISTTDSQGLYSYDQITLIPGEVYPDNDIRIVEIQNESDFISREPCCGTHVLNTADLEDFCIVSVKSLGRSSSSLHGVTGERAKLARRNAADLAEDIGVFKKSLAAHLDTPDMLDMGVLSLKQRLNFDVTDDFILPYVYKQEALEELNAISRQIKEKSNEDLRNFVDMEMHDALERKVEVTASDRKFIVHYLRSSMMFESVPLQRATAMCSDMPVIVIAYSDSMVKARCCVPQALQTQDFDAEKWLKQSVASVFEGQISPQKSQNGILICNMKAKKIHVQDWHHLLAESVNIAKNYINSKL